MKFLADILLCKGAGLILDDAGDQGSFRIDSTKMAVVTPTARDFVVSPEGVERFRVKNTSYGIVVSTHVIPVANNTHDLGSTSARFRASYAVTGDFSGQVTIGSIPHYGSASTNFLVSNGGLISYRSNTEVLTDIGAMSSSGSFYLGTTSIALNRSSAAQSLTGINIDGNAGTATLAANSTQWNTYTLDNSTAYSSGFDYLFARTSSTAQGRLITSGALKSWAGYYTSGDNPTFGTVTGTTFTGNAATATALQTARTINGVSFNGTADITITAAVPNALTVSSGLQLNSGTTFDGSAARTISIATGGVTNSMLQNSTISGVSLGSNLALITFNNGGSGAGSGSQYNGAGAITVSWNTLGALPLVAGTSNPLTGVLRINMTGSHIEINGTDGQAYINFMNNGTIDWYIGTQLAGANQNWKLYNNTGVASIEVNKSSSEVTFAAAIYGTYAQFSSFPTMGGNTKYFTMYDAVAGGVLKYATVSDVQTYLGLGSAAYTSSGSYAPASGSGNYIQNQYSSAQSAEAWISGRFRAGSNAIIEGTSDLYGQLTVYAKVRVSNGTTFMTRLRGDAAIIDFTNTAESTYVAGTINSSSLNLNTGTNGNVITGGDFYVYKSSPVLAFQNPSSITSGSRGDMAWYNSSTSTVALIRGVAVTDNVGTYLQTYIRPPGGSLTVAQEITTNKDLFQYGNININNGSNSYLYGQTTNSFIRIDNAIGAQMGYAANGGFSYIADGGNLTMVAAGSVAATINSSLQATFTGTVTANGGSFIVNHSSGQTYIYYLNNGSPDWAVGTQLGTGTQDYRIWNYGTSSPAVSINKTTNSVSLIGTLYQTVSGGQMSDKQPGTGTVYVYEYYHNSGGTMYLGIERSTTGGLATGTHGYASIFGSTNGTSTQLISNGTVGFTLNASSNVGIGTTSPGEKLTVQGVAGNWTVNVTGSTSTNNSYGLLITAGTSASDRAMYVQNASGSSVLYYMKGNGDTVWNGVSTFANTVYFGNFAAMQGSALYFDGASDTYMHEVSANVIRMVAGGSAAATFSSSLADFMGSVNISGNTRDLTFKAGGQNMGRIASAYSAADYSAIATAGDFVVTRNATGGYSYTKLILANQNNGIIAFSFGTSDGNDVMQAYFDTCGNFYAQSLTPLSDRKVKDLIQRDFYVKDIEKLKPHLYIKSGRKELGYFAQEAREICPHAVHETLTGFLGLSYNDIFAAKIYRLETVEEQMQKRIEQLEREVVRLGGSITY